MGNLQAMQNPKVSHYVANVASTYFKSKAHTFVRNKKNSSTIQAKTNARQT